MTAPCLHGCGRPGDDRRRGLCRHCHADPAVRALYPLRTHRPGRKPAAPRVADTTAPGRPPTGPCPHPPGSPGRLATLRLRAGLGQLLTHPQDADFSALEAA